MKKRGINLHKKVKKPLFTTLLLWFLLLALLPIGISNWLNYHQAEVSLIKSVHNTLAKESNATREYISTWFDYRFMDLSLQAKAQNNIGLVTTLSDQFDDSKLPLKDYIRTFEWNQTVQEKQFDLLQMMVNYDYIHDIFLIDTRGNILFSITSEKDLGTNVFTGNFSKTKFAKIVDRTLISGEKQFSDIEYYHTANNLPSGFMTAPLIDLQGNTVGVFAIQLNLKRIFDRLLSKDSDASSLTNYFVGQDRLLRSPIKKDLQSILKQKVSSLVIDDWLANDNALSDLVVHEYQGPEGEVVIGAYQQIEALNIKWVLVSEINKSEVFSPIHEMAMGLLVICIVSILVVLGLAILQAKRILAPINELMMAAIKVIQGETNQQVDVKADNEIGRLADVFNTMLSKRLQSDMELKKSNNSLRKTMLELSGQQYALDQHAIVAITDIHGSIEFVNEKFCLISGYNYDELLGTDHSLMSSGIHDASFFVDMYQTIQSGDVWHGQVCNKNKDGSLYWLETTIAPFKDENENILSFIEIRTDITEQKEYDAKQRIALAMSDIKLNIAKELVTSTSLTKRLSQSLTHLFALSGFNLSNEAGLFIFDDNTSEFSLNVQFGDFGDNQEALLSDLKEQCQGQIIFPEFIQGTSSSLLIRNGNIQAHGHYIVPILTSKSEENETGLLGVLYLFTDPEAHLSEEKQVLLEELVDLFSAAIVREKARELLKQATIAAQQSSVLKGEFLASMSHEIRTPMNGVLGMLGLLQNSDLNYEQLHKANLAKSSAESLLVLINDILDFSKVEAGKLELDFIDFNIHELMGDFSESMAFRAQDKGLEIILDMMTVEHSMVKGDPGRIRQILTNIVGNAIKFTDVGEIKIEVALDTIESGNLRLTCKVTDSGIGIPEHKIGMLCDSFSQVDASTTRKYGGTGLGLAISKKLCELMSGEINISSELGQGSCFTFTAELTASLERQNALPKVDISQLHLLIVDDNETNRDVLRSQLEHWGATVVETASAKEALRCCEKRLEDGLPIFDVAFLDMQMPEMDGAELGKAIRYNPSFNDMHMVMMTSIANQNETNFFAKLGFDAYFPKPATTKDLYDALNVVVDNGIARKKAVPLVTRDYLHTLTPKNGITVENLSTKISKQKDKLDKNKTKLLLVEDNVINQQVALGVLAEFGFTAEIAENGQIALDLLNSPYEKFDLILMDCQMPVLDGYETTQAIRAGEAGADYTEIPIIAMTANAMQGDRNKCLNAGMDDYIAKPIDPHLLESTLYRWLLGNKADAAASALMEVIEEKEEDKYKISWDQPSALSRLLNNESLLVDLLITFKQEMPLRIDELKTNVELENHASVRTLAHTIKGAASNISGLCLTAHAFELEKLGGDNDATKYNDLLAKIIDAYQELESNFVLYIEQYKAKKHLNKSDNLLSDQQLYDKLASLLQRLKASEFIDGEEVELLISNNSNSKISELLDQLYTQVSMFNLTAALETTNLAIICLSDESDEKPEI